MSPDHRYLSLEIHQLNSQTAVERKLPKLDLNFEDCLLVGFLVSQAVAHWTLPGYT
jgi:hypothetical protein